MSLSEGKGEIPAPKNGNGKANKEDLDLATWRESLNGRFPSHMEKLRSKLIGQRDTATAANVRAFIGRKIRMLNELLDGPTPEPDQQARPAATAPKPAENPMSPDELLESAHSALALGAKYLTAQQKAALAAARV